MELPVYRPLDNTRWIVVNLKLHIEKELELSPKYNEG